MSESDAVLQMRRALKALYLEVPASIGDDLNSRFDDVLTLHAALEAKLEAMGSLVAAARALSNDVHEAFPEGLDKLDADPKDVAGYAALIWKLDAALAAAQQGEPGPEVVDRG